MKLSKLWMFVALLIPVRAFSYQPFVANWEIAEHQPDLRQGGRANAVAVDPSDVDELLAASDSGGLFKSMNGGADWTHIDSLPVIFLNAVAYVDSDTILVSAAPDFKKENGGGVWRSADGGATWTQAKLNVPNFDGPLTAFQISTSSNNAVVGTSRGLFVSTDGGVNWEYHDPFSHQGPVHAVLVTAPDPEVPEDSFHIYAGGPAGMRLNTIPLEQWVPPASPNVGGIHPIHAFERSPLTRPDAFVTNGHLLFYTEDDGKNWTEIGTKVKSPCGGGPFVRAALRPDFLDLYYGDGCGLRRLKTPIVNGAVDFSNAIGAWGQLVIERSPTRDLAVFGKEPLLLATNGGLEKTSDLGATWTFAGGGRNGYSAYQVAEIKGQYITELDLTDLYFATRDNGLWAADTDADTIPPALPDDAFGLEMSRRVASPLDAQITWKARAACGTRIFDRHLVAEQVWNDAPGGMGAPVLVREGQYVQNAPAGLDLTDDFGMNWQPFVAFPEEPLGRPKLARAFSTGAVTILYQSFLAGGVTKLLRIDSGFGNVNVIRPAMNGFGSLGSRRLRDVYPMYAVDPHDHRIVVAADVGTQQMMRTTNGGGTWAAIPDLADVTDGGRLQFRSDLNGFADAPVVTAIGFSPQQNSSFVLAGTIEGGVYFSSDRGATWGRITGSERATYVTSFFWEDVNTVYASTYGRGLWKLTNRPIAPPFAFPDLCPSCDVVSTDPAQSPPPFDASILVFEGRILGWRRENGKLREVFVTRGASVVFTGDPKDVQEDIAVTEGGCKECEAPPKPPQHGWVVAGVVFTSDDTLTGAAFASSERSLPE